MTLLRRASTSIFLKNGLEQQIFECMVCSNVLSCSTFLDLEIWSRCGGSVQDVLLTHTEMGWGRAGVLPSADLLLCCLSLLLWPELTPLGPGP